MDRPTHHNNNNNNNNTTTCNLHLHIASLPRVKLFFFTQLYNKILQSEQILNMQHKQHHKNNHNMTIDN